jgi:hypothetical protein
MVMAVPERPMRRNAVRSGITSRTRMATEAVSMYSAGR